MSYIGMYSNYNINSSLLSSFSSANSSKSWNPISSTTSDSLLNMYSYIYGKNTNKTSSSVSGYQVNLKEKSSDLISSLETLSKKGSSSVFDKIGAVSDSSAITATYSGKSIGEEITVDVEQIASTQKNQGNSLKSNASTLSSTSLNITASDGTKKTFYVSTNNATNKEVQTNLAEKINKANIGVTASVVTNEKKGTSQLVLESSETGTDNSFTVSGNLAKELGVTTATQNAKDAIYSINGGEKQTSSKNTVEINDDLTLKFKNTTDKTANISYSKNDTSGINAARELVNSYNALLKTAKDYGDSGSSRLESQLTGAVNTYSGALSKIGITKNKKGYLEIDENKMQKSAESGELSKFFNSNSQTGKNYGFTNRLSTIAEKANNDPTQYLSQSSKNQLNIENGTSYVSSLTSGKSNNYISTYFNLSSKSMLLDLFV